MCCEPDPAVLYPDVASHGSLAAALQAAAADQGLSLPLAVAPSDPLRHATFTSVVPHRHSSYVTAWHHERRWSIRGSSNDQIMICGNTEDLHDLPRVIHGWAGDYTIREWWDGPVLHRVATPSEAIVIAVDRIPADLLQPSSEDPAQGS